DQLRHRQIGEDGDAEIAPEHRRGPGPEAGLERLVEAKRLADALDVGDGGDIAGDDSRRVAWRQVEQRENDDGYDPDHQDRSKQTPDDISEHAAPNVSLQSAKRALGFLSGRIFYGKPEGHFS